MNEKMEGLLTAHKIESLEKELEENYISSSRRGDITRFFRKTLGEGPYYSVSAHNPASELFRTVRLDSCMSRNYSGYSSRTSYSLAGGTALIDNIAQVPVIVQDINPRTAMDFYYMDSYRVFYVSERALKETEIIK